MKKSKLLDQSFNANAGYKYYHILCCCYVATMMTSLTVSARLLPFHVPLTNFVILLTGGTWTIPISFAIQDIITEVYGINKSRHAIHIALVILIAYVFYTTVITYFPTVQSYRINDSYSAVFQALPRHLLALIATIITGIFINNYLLSKLKIFFRGKYLAFRFISSTSVGELILQLVGTTIAWFGHLKFSSEILPFVMLSYGYKIIFSTAMLPITCTITNFLKKSEKIDIYDWKVSYNPFYFKKS